MTTNLTEYWAELAKKAGLPEDKVTPVLEALKDEAVQKTFKDGFKALPDYSRDLDSVRDRTKAETAAEVEGKYSDWYKQADAAYKHNLTIAEDYEKYQELYGSIDGNGNQPDARYLTQEQLDKRLNELFQARDKAYIGLQKQMARIVSEHVSKFNEPLDIDALEKLALDRGVDLPTAYQSYIQPRVEKANTEEWEAKLKTAREEGAREAMSRHNVPIDTRPKDPSLFSASFATPKEGVVEDKAAMNEFLSGYTEWEQKQTAQ